MRVEVISVGDFEEEEAGACFVFFSRESGLPEEVSESLVTRIDRR